MKKVTWSQLKTFVDDRSLSIQFLEFEKYYDLVAVDGVFVLNHIMDKYPSDTTELAEFEASYKDVGNRSVGNQSIKLMLAKVKAPTILATGIADASIKIPGTFGVNGNGTLKSGRVVAGGEATFSSLDFGDYITAEVRDDDNLLGFGAGTVLDTFHDLGVASGEEGWYFLGRPMNLQPVVNDDPTNLPSGMHLHVIGHKALPLPLAEADTLHINIHWGRRIR